MLIDWLKIVGVWLVVRFISWFWLRIIFGCLRNVYKSWNFLFDKVMVILEGFVSFCLEIFSV